MIFCITFYFIGCFFVYVYLIYKKKLSWSELGFRKGNFLQSVVPHTIFTLCVLAWFVFLFRPDISQRWAHVDVLWIFIVGNVLWSFVQELILHGYLSVHLEKYTKYHVVEYLIAAFLYTRIHVPLVDSLFELFVSAVLFLVWWWVWKYWPNMYLSTISHTILNLFVTWLGLFSAFG